MGKQVINNNVSTNNTTRTIFFTNLDYFRENLGASQGDFCAELGISSTMYDKYRTGSMPNATTLRLIVDCVNALIKKDAGLHDKFLTDILCSDMKGTDLTGQTGLRKPLAPPVHSDLYVNKFVGVYLCYYRSTNPLEKNTPRYGVILIEESPDNKLVTTGIFASKSLTSVIAIQEELLRGTRFAEVLANYPSVPVFHGEAHLSNNLLWGTMMTDDLTEFVTMSFDLSENVVSKRPEKTFLGCRGIALSQSTGSAGKTVTFPVVISKENLSATQTELKKYLCFNNNPVDFSMFTAMARTVITLLDSLSQAKLNDALKEELVAQTLKVHFQAILNEKVYNNHSFSDDEMDEFYRRVIKPAAKETRRKTQE